MYMMGYLWSFLFSSLVLLVDVRHICAMHSSRYFINRYADFAGSIGDCSYVRELIPRLLSKIETKCPPTSHENSDGGLYVGPAGIGYSFYHVAECGLFLEHRQQLLMKALEYLKIPQAQAARESPHSNGGIGAAFLLGHAGVYAVSALVYDALGLHEEKEQSYKKFLDMHNICKPVNFFPYGSDELLVGRSGYLCAVLELNRKLKTKLVPNEVTFPLLDAMLQSGVQYGHHHKTASPLMYSYYSTEYLGTHYGQLLC